MTHQVLTWAELKALGPNPPVQIRPVQRVKVPCRCVHTAKHHKKSGRCKGDCLCEAGLRVAI